MRINEIINEGRAQEIVHKNPSTGTLKALAKNNKYGSVRFVIYNDGTLVAADSEHFTHHSMAPGMGAWDVRGYVQHQDGDSYAYRSMNVYDPMPKDHPLFKKWEQLGIENGNDNESLDEDVGGNYLYYSRETAQEAKQILNSGYIKASEGAQDATAAQIGDLPFVSMSRSLSYAVSGKNVNRDYQVVFVINRNALELHYRTIGTSQSGETRGLKYQDNELQNLDPSARRRAKGRAARARDMIDTYKDNTSPADEIKIKNDLYNRYFRSKSGNEFEEVVPVKNGKLSLRGILVGFYLVPGKAASQDPELINHPLRLEMPRPNTFVKATQKTVAENFDDGKGPGRPGDSQRHGIPKKASMAQLEKAAKATGRKGQLARWQLNMRRGKKKVNEEKYTVDRNGIQLSVSIDGATVEVRPMHDNKQLGYVVFDRDGKTLVADDLSIDDEYRGKGIAKIIYDYIKELGFIIKRSSDQTSSGKKYWDKHAGEQGKIWEDNTIEDDDRKQMIADFVKFALKQLKCEHKPKIKLVTDNQQVQDYKSFGGTNIHNGEIWVYIQNRNLADLLRTLCHELVHYKQFKDGRIKGPEDGKTGSELENEANSQAGIILRHYGKMNPAIFESKGK